MIAFILAAGFGTRLRPLTDHIPKAMVGVCGKPLLERALELFGKGVASVIGVNAHYLSHSLKEYRALSAIPFNLFIEKERILGTAGGLYNVKDFLSAEETFCVYNADIVCNIDIVKLHERFILEDCDCGLIVVPSTLSPTVYYSVKEKIFLGTKFQPAALSGEFVGIAFYRRRFLDLITSDDFSIVPVWHRAENSGYRVKILEVPQLWWRDIGTASSLANIHFEVLDGKVNLSIPPLLKLDIRSKQAYPKCLAKENIGDFCWIENQWLPKSCHFSRVIIYRNSLFDCCGKCINAILTPWGTIYL